jgi:Spy/CpxP family protein refolding chaperone
MRPLLSASLAVAALLGAAPAALAQAAPAESVPAKTAPAPVTSARAQCRAQIDSRSLTGPERKAAMRDCMRPQHDACREQAIAKGLAKGPDRKAFMHQCMHGTLAQGQ